MGIIKKLFGKPEKISSSNDELKAAVLKKATEHWDANSEPANPEEKEEDGVSKKSFPEYEDIDKIKKQKIRAVLLEVAEGGETGVLPISVSDKTGISQQDTATALAFLAKENYAEAVNSATGFKYYLTAAGRKYCISKEFNS